MSDVGLSDTVLHYKQVLVDFVTKHHAFLAYCDMEQNGIFQWTNGYQALTKQEFLECYDIVCSDLIKINSDFTRYVPKVYLSILDTLQYIIDVRNRHGEDLVIPPTFREIPKIGTLTTSDMKIIFSSFEDRSPLNELKSVLYLAYMHMIPIYILSTVQWMFTMHGDKKEGMTSLIDVVNPSTLEFAQQFKKLASSRSTSALKRRLIELPLMKRVFAAVDDTTFFDTYTDTLLGETSINIIGNLIRVYLRNVELLVIADMLFSGFYASVSNEHQLSYCETSRIIDKTEKDLSRLLSSTYQTTLTKNIIQRYLRTLNIALKKVKRYHARIVAIQHADEDDDATCPTYIQMLFGDMSDSDGQPVVCAICLESSEETKDTWLPLACNHVFHCHCLDRLVKSNTPNKKACPLCRCEL